MSVFEKYGPHSWDLLAGVVQPELSMELKGSRVTGAGGRGSTSVPGMGWGGGQVAQARTCLCEGHTLSWIGEGRGGEGR